MGLIPEDIVTQVIERCDIVDVIGSYIPLKKTGQNFKAPCPFHNEKTPSFVVNPNKQIFHCFGCGVGGNVVSFVMKQDHLVFPEAIRYLAAKVNVEIPENDARDSADSSIFHEILKVNHVALDFFHNNLLDDKSSESEIARQYLKKRGVSLDAVKKFRLGCALNTWDSLYKKLQQLSLPNDLLENCGLLIKKDSSQGYYDRFRNRIIFPIFDTRGEVRAFGARLLEGAQNSTDKISAKYINSPETKVYVKGDHLYGFHLAKEEMAKQDFVVIVEGYMDALMPQQAGFLPVVASLGTALTPSQIRLVRRYTKNVVMLFDMDEAGESAMMRSLDMLLEEDMVVKVASLPTGEDPDSFIKNKGVEQFRSQIDQAQLLFDYKVSVLQKKINTDTVEGKSELIERMLPTIKSYKNAVVRSGYLKKLEKMFDVSEAALTEEFNKTHKTSWRSAQEPAKKANLRVIHSSRCVERNILKLILEDESLFATAKEEISVSDFADENIRKVMSKIYEIFETEKMISTHSLLNSFQEDDIQHMISEIVNDERMVVLDKKKMYEDCISRMKKNRLKKQRGDLLLQIKEAERMGDQERLHSLKEQFNNTVKL